MRDFMDIVKKLFSESDDGNKPPKKD